jgi:hypothetical protein
MRWRKLRQTQRRQPAGRLRPTRRDLLRALALRRAQMRTRRWSGPEDQPRKPPGAPRPPAGNGLPKRMIAMLACPLTPMSG